MYMSKSNCIYNSIRIPILKRVVGGLKKNLNPNRLGPDRAAQPVVV
jgi:hypothetical protein